MSEPLISLNLSQDGQTPLPEPETISAAVDVAALTAGLARRLQMDEAVISAAALPPEDLNKAFIKAGRNATRMNWIGKPAAVAGVAAGLLMMFAPALFLDKDRPGESRKAREVAGYTTLVGAVLSLGVYTSDRRSAMAKNITARANENLLKAYKTGTLAP